MADQKIEVRGKIEKIVRQSGKAEAQMVVLVPLAQANDIPLGAVVMNIQTLQKHLFGKDEKEVKKGKK